MKDTDVIREAAQLGWDRVLFDPTDLDILTCVEELTGREDIVRAQTWQGARLRQGIIAAWEHALDAASDDVEAEPILRGIVRRVCSTYGL